jgi:hypothetical protein
MDLQTQLTSDILDLEQKILEDSPLMPQVLRKIHHELGQNPALISPLTDEQIAVITKGLSIFTKAEIITAKKKAPSKASLAKTSVLDLL